MRRRLHAIAVLAALSGVLHAQPREVVVSAAASLGEVLRELAPRYERTTGERVIVNVGASNTLARQIAAGADVDVFISADDAQLDGVRAQIAPGSRVALLSNRLAIVVPSDRAGTVRAAGDLTSDRIRRIALGDPAVVPAGVYARRYLEQAGIWVRVRAKIVPSGSVRLALAAVQRGAVDAAIVYGSDVASAGGIHLAYLVPPHEGPPIRYPGAVMTGGGNAAGGRRFLAYLQTPEAASVFSRAGFLPLSRGTPETGAR